MCALRLSVIDLVLHPSSRPGANRIAGISDPDYIGIAFHLDRHVLTTQRDLEHVWLIRDEVTG